MGTFDLRSVRIVEFGHYIAAPFCTQILADQGAEVIKVEPPDGDTSRSTEHMSYNDIYFHSLNRNKRSVMMDLKDPDAMARLEPLLRSADVLVTNYAVGVPDKLGFGYEQIRQINPQIVYVHASGFGTDSPYARRPAFDGIIQAMSGLMHLTGEPDGQPMQAGIFIPDHVTGLYAALAVMFGLARREATGEGSYTDLSMLDCMFSLLGPAVAEVVQLGTSPKRVGSKVRRSFAGTYDASDGYVYMAPMSARMWAGLAEMIGQPDLVDFFPAQSAPDSRLANRPALDATINAWTSRRTVDELVHALSAAGIPCSRIFALDELIGDEHIARRGMVRRIPHLSGAGEVVVAGSPLRVLGDPYAVPPPAIGQDTADLLG